MPWILRTKTGAVIPIPDGGELSIGRDPKCTIRMNIPAVSRVHCRLRAEANHVVLTAEGRNGTLVNGIRVGQIAYVGVGDVLGVDTDEWQVQRAEGVPTIIRSDVVAVPSSEVVETVPPGLLVAATPQQPFVAPRPTTAPLALSSAPRGALSAPPPAPTAFPAPVTGEVPAAVVPFEVEVVEDANASSLRYRDAIRLAEDHALLVMTDFVAPPDPALIQRWKGVVRKAGSRGRGPDDILRLLNQELFEAQLQAVATAARMHMSERIINVACAGTAPPFVVRADGGRVARVQPTPSVTLGRVRNAQFAEKSLHFDRGDTFLLPSASWMPILEGLFSLGQSPVPFHQARAAEWLRAQPSKPLGGSLLCLALR